jgi:hypothetical protein
MGAIRRGLAMELASALAEISSPVIPIPFPFHQPRAAGEKGSNEPKAMARRRAFDRSEPRRRKKEIINLITPKQKQWGTNSNHQSKMGEKNAEAKNPNQQQQTTHTKKRRAAEIRPRRG